MISVTSTSVTMRGWGGGRVCGRERVQWRTYNAHFGTKFDIWNIWLLCMNSLQNMTWFSSPVRQIMSWPSQMPSQLLQDKEWEKSTLTRRRSRGLLRCIGVGEGSRSGIGSVPRGHLTSYTHKVESFNTITTFSAVLIISSHYVNLCDCVLGECSQVRKPG